MPLPQFDMRGLLPPFMGVDATTQERSPYLTDMPELVATLGTTPARRQLLRNLISYRQILNAEGYTSGIQFVDGSFVENVEANSGRPPGDIDVFSILNAPHRYIANPPDWAVTGLPFWQAEIVDRNRNKQRFALDTYALLFEELQPLHLIKSTIYWYGLFSHQRGTLAWKGFAAIMLDPAGDQAALTALGSA